MLSATVAGAEIRMVPANIVTSIAASVAISESAMVVEPISEIVLPVLAATSAETLMPRVAA
jgi:hypothetical protein